MLTLFILSYTLGAVVTYGALLSWLHSVRRCTSNKLDAFGFSTVWPLAVIVGLYFDGRKPFQSGLKFY